MRISEWFSKCANRGHAALAKNFERILGIESSEDESVSFWIYKSDDSVLRLQATKEGLTNVKRDLKVYEAYQSVSNAELGR